MPEPLRWLLAALACYRLSQFLGLDDGPWDVMQIIRERLGAYKLGPEGVPVTWWGYLLRCPYCLGLYTAPAFAALCIWPTRIGDVLLGALAIAGAQALLQGRRTGWLGDKPLVAAAKPRLRMDADGNVRDA